MKTVAVLFALLLAPLLSARAQDQPAPAAVQIGSVDLSGLSIDDLSPDLRRDIRQLVGTALDPDALSALASRIESEHPDVVTAVRAVPHLDDKARVVFLVARLDDDSSLRSNVNAQYIVEKVSIAGVDESKVSQALRDELQTLVGHPLDHDLAERLRDRLSNELSGRHVRRRMLRGSERGRTQVVFDVDRQMLIPYSAPASKILYHGDLGWTGDLDVEGEGHDVMGNVGIVLDNRDDLVEHDRGFRLGFQTRKIVSAHVGAGLRLSWLRQSWEQVTLDTLAANPSFGEAYQKRRTVEPWVTVAFAPPLRMTAGYSATELDPRTGSGGSTESQMANALVLSFDYDQRWRPAPGIRHGASASYLIRATTSALGGDFTYRRHHGEAHYEYEQGPNRLLADVSFGGITGTAPLFERFSLGDTTTLRGWNQYDLAPVGGDRFFHESIEYRFHSAALFLDAGSVWTSGAEHKTRLSTGFGFHGDHAFATVALPLNADKVEATFMMGIRY